MTTMECAEAVGYSADIDYALGWRWLLPSRGSRIRRLIGWSVQEMACLGESTSCHAGRQPAEWVLNADRKPADIALMRELSNVEYVALVGRGRQVRKWEQIVNAAWSGQMHERCDYALIPPSNPRLLVPLQSGKAALEGLSFHTPGSLAGRLSVGLLRALAGLGVMYPMRRRVLVTMKRINGADSAPQEAGRVSPACTVYLGVAGASRKTVALIGAAERAVVCKSASNLDARRRVHQEAAALRLLRPTPLSEHVPALLKVDEQPQRTDIFIEYRRRVGLSNGRIQREAFEFLLRLGKVNQESADLRQFVRSRIDSADEIPGEGLRARQRESATRILGLGHPLVWMGYSHGDFAPWNCSMTAQGFFVFDWEDFDARGLLLADVFRWVSADQLLLKRDGNPKVMAAKAIELGAALAAHWNVSIHAPTQFVLWCLLQGRAYRPEFYVSAAEAALESQWNQP